MGFCSHVREFALTSQAKQVSLLHSERVPFIGLVSTPPLRLNCSSPGIRRGCVLLLGNFPDPLIFFLIIFVFPLAFVSPKPALNRRRIPGHANVSPDSPGKSHIFKRPIPPPPPLSPASLHSSTGCSFRKNCCAPWQRE